MANCFVELHMFCLEHFYNENSCWLYCLAWPIESR